MSPLTRVLAVLALSASWSAFGAGGGSMPSPMPSASQREPVSPQEQARSAYDQGVRGVEKGDGLLADAARQPDARKQQKLRDKAQGAYAGALRRFTRATELNPALHEAWNYLGYCQRKLGRFDAALAAYDRALSLKADYAEAIEYRGHAYLGLNRLADAKGAYLALFASNRQLAASLLVAMQQWVGEHRGTGVVEASAVESFASWVNERQAIATQTAGLTREGAAATWR
jgi:tetratricopeptide (TPR) repeat protein